ncbi:pep-cterm exosortase interaction domain-containing protein [Leptolyngbya sp. Heron Island J]|nr:pep-cterm exosortase interaction domain-containing protein [Leptolyngbya sp. Heron Island J]
MNRVWLLAATTVGVVLSNTQVSFAQTVTYDFTVDVTSGPLSGESYVGETSVDITNLLLEGNETVQSTSITFNFGNVEFTEADDVQDLDARSPRANFQDDNFLGNTYIVSRFGNRPIEIPLIDNVPVDGFAIDNSEFGYVVGADLYRGVVNYALPLDSDTPNAQPVPEPSLWLGFILVGYWLRRRLA